MAHELAPMKAATLKDLGDLVLPVYGSPKLDGYRCRIVDGVAMTNNMKPFRNRYVQAVLGYKSLSGLDGELIVGDPRNIVPGTTVLGRSGAVTAYEGEPDFTFWVFDRWDRPDRPFSWRLGSAEDIIDDHHRKPLSLVPHELLYHMGQVIMHEADALAQGYEGTCYRKPTGLHKNGRSTNKEGLLLKFKRFTDGEGVVVRLKEAQHNENEATQDELGRKKRSTKAAGKVNAGKIGVIVVADLKTGEEMELGPGTMTAGDRAKLWRQPKLIVGKVVHWRAFGYGVKDSLRHAHFYAFRDRDDL